MDRKGSINVFVSRTTYADNVNSEELLELCQDSIAQVKQFMYILYGSCVRFYSTVVEWDFLQQMKEDLIERLTSMVFDDE